MQKILLPKRKMGIVKKKNKKTTYMSCIKKNKGKSKFLIQKKVHPNSLY